MSSSMDRFHLHALSVQFDSFLNKVQAKQTIACMAAQDEKKCTHCTNENHLVENI